MAHKWNDGESFSCIWHVAERGRALENILRRPLTTPSFHSQFTFSLFSYKSFNYAISAFKTSLLCAPFVLVEPRERPLLTSCCSGCAIKVHIYDGLTN